ncbi:iron-sulfur cluster biosynthesis protein [Pseudonocardiaceae bacterium YIM PH 21723]|nr:iron-sulfur cluster biosynthesis protein [Pseudonocardiaceae bacterium YIM PH 21723]
MLEVTNAAGQAINALTSNQSVPDGAGLRISVHEEKPEGASLAIAVTGGPEQSDEVVTSEAGSKVFIEETANPYLTDKVLDAQSDQEGQIQFQLRGQG